MSVYVGGVDGNSQVEPSPRMSLRVLLRRLRHSSRKAFNCGPLKPSEDAVHVSSVRVAGWPPMVEGLHVDLGGVTVTAVLPSGHVTATAQADCSWLLLAVAELLILFVLSAVALELLSAVLVFELAQSNRLCYNS